MDVELVEQEADKTSYSRDLLQRFASRRCGEELLPPHRKMEGAEDSVDVGMELSLGLSLGGCFEIETKETGLLRSSSAAMISVFPTEVDFSLSSSQLVRACSLPVEAEEEHLKRKEMQGLKRMEAKRKRLEKSSSSRPDVGCGRREEQILIAETYGDFSVRRAVGGGASSCGGVDGLEVQTGPPEAMPRSSLGFNGRGLQGSEVSTLNSTSVVQSKTYTDQKSPIRAPLPPLLRSLNSLQEEDDVLKAMSVHLNRSEDVGRNIMAEMPFVSTKGDGPNGMRVEGFLYKHKKGEDVRIVCVCHGNFHTPAEFVRHAGGSDVANPLRHIVVNPSPPIYY